MNAFFEVLGTIKPVRIIKRNENIEEVKKEMKC